MARTRVTVTGAYDVPNVRYGYHRPNCVSGWTQTSATTTYSGKVVTKTITDVETPAFHHLLECGAILPFNPVLIETRGEEYIFGDGVHSSGWNGTCYTDYSSGKALMALVGQVYPPALDDEIIDQVVNAAIADAKAAAWDELTFLAELRQTISLFRDTYHAVNLYAVRAARWAVNVLRQRNPRSFTTENFRHSLGLLIKLFNQKWLEYRYGWRPLMFDLQNACNAFVAGLHVGSVVRGKAKVVTDLADSRVVVSTAGSLTCTEVFTISGTRTYRGRAYGKVTNAALATTGFDPLVTAYELMKYSFVLDWFLDVGTWLQAVTPFSGVDISRSGWSVKDTWESRRQSSGSWSSPTETGVFTGSEVIVTMDSYQRAPKTIGPTHWNVQLGWKRITDLVTLVLQGRTAVNRILRI